MLQTAKVGRDIILATTILCLLLIHSLSEKPLLVTKEELARHDGIQVKGVYWLSIMSQVFDVTKGADDFYKEGSYNIFVGRDATLPYISGNFTAEEAARPYTDMTPHELWNLDHWKEFYVNETRYPFMGYLIGDLYDQEGNPTPLMEKLKGLIQQGHDEWHAAHQANKEKVDAAVAKAAEKKKRIQEKRKLDREGESKSEL